MDAPPGELIIQEAAALYKHFAENADSKRYFIGRFRSLKGESPNNLSCQWFQKKKLIKCGI
jgi:hypothetical protein